MSINRLELRKEYDEFPKSLNTNQKAYVRFFNISKRNVEIIWLNFEGIGVPYKILRSKQYIDIDTFYSHFW